MLENSTEQNNESKKTPPSGVGGLRGGALSVVKIGGNVIEDAGELDAFLDSFTSLPAPKILVHGGGKLATQMAERLGIEVKMTQGRRVTDAETLDVIAMVYGGKVNKNIVAQLQAKGCNAIGLSGADGNAIRSVKRPVKEVDFGFVGDIAEVDGRLISALLEAGLTPIFCAITHDGNGQLLNTNADTVACEVARALAQTYEVALYYCFEKAGVLRDVNDETSVIEKIDSQAYAALIDAGVIAHGMLPKMHNCFHALEGGVQRVKIGKVSMLYDASAKHTCLSL